MNRPVPTCRTLERAAVGLGIGIVILLMVCAFVNLYFHLAGAPTKEKPAPTQGASK